MNPQEKIRKRNLAASAAAAMLIALGVAAVDASNPENMLATDGKIEVVDGRHVQEITRELPFKSGETLDLGSMNGKITVTGWDKDRLHITATKQIERNVGSVGWLFNKLNIRTSGQEIDEEFFEQTRVKVSGTADGVAVETIYPEKRSGVNIAVHYDVKLPRNAHLVLRTSNGSVTVANIEGTVRSQTSNGRVTYESIDGAVEAKTSNGRIICKGVNGTVTARTSNGPIEIEHPDTIAQGGINCRTSNGSITVCLGSGSGFDVDLSTSNGRVASDFNVDTTNGSKTRTKLIGRVGSGGPLVELRSSNGSIVVTQG